MADMTYGFQTSLPLPAFLTRVSALAATWQRRARQRAELAELSDLELHDLPVSRDAAEFEMRKPFWRD